MFVCKFPVHAFFSNIYETERTHNLGIRRLKCSYEIGPPPLPQNEAGKNREKLIVWKNRFSKNDLETDSTNLSVFIKSIGNVSWQKEHKLILLTEFNSHTILNQCYSFI